MLLPLLILIATAGASSSRGRLHELRRRLDLAAVRPRETPIQRVYRQIQTEDLPWLAKEAARRFGDPELETVVLRTMQPVLLALLGVGLGLPEAFIDEAQKAPPLTVVGPPAVPADVPTIRPLLSWFVRAWGGALLDDIAVFQQAFLQDESLSDKKQSLRTYAAYALEEELAGFMRPWAAFLGVVDWAHATPGLDVGRLTFPQAVVAQEAWHRQFRRQVGFRQPVTLSMPVCARWADGWTLVLLVSRQAFVEEGASMGHCIGGPLDREGIPSGESRYIQASRDGRATYYSLRDPNNLPHATVEVERALGYPKDLRVLQLQGVADGRVQDLDAALHLEQALQAIVGEGSAVHLGDIRMRPGLFCTGAYWVTLSPALARLGEEVEDVVARGVPSSLDGPDARNSRITVPLLRLLDRRWIGPYAAVRDRRPQQNGHEIELIYEPRGAGFYEQGPVLAVFLWATSDSPSSFQRLVLRFGPDRPVEYALWPGMDRSPREEGLPSYAALEQAPSLGTSLWTVVRDHLILSPSLLFRKLGTIQWGLPIKDRGPALSKLADPAAQLASELSVPG